MNLKYRVIVFISLILSVISITILLFSLQMPLDPNTLPIIVGILTLLVTVLIGWQIFTIISIDEKIDKSIKQITTNVQIEMVKIKHDAVGISTAMQASSSYHLANYGEAFRGCINALNNLSCGTLNDKLNKNCVDMCFLYLDMIAGTNNGLILTKEDQDIYLTILYKINDHRARKIIKFVDDAELRPKEVDDMI